MLLLSLARNFPERVIEDLVQDLMRVYEYHYPLNPDKDVTSIISTILVTLKRYSQAVPILLDSIIDYGATAAKSARLGLVLFNVINQFISSFMNIQHLDRELRQVGSHFVIKIRVAFYFLIGNNMFISKLSSYANVVY